MKTKTSRKRESGKAIPNSRLMAGPNERACSSNMWAWSAAVVSRKRTAVRCGVIGWRRLVARQQKNPMNAELATMIAGGNPILAVNAVPKAARTISATACWTF
jgi:hypothetical protein